MMLTPLAPKAGPIGGGGVLPFRQGMASLMYPATAGGGVEGDSVSGRGRGSAACGQNATGEGDEPKMGLRRARMRHPSMNIGNDTLLVYNVALN